MSEKPTVLIVDDQPGEILWLLELLDERGYRTHIVTNEQAANKQLNDIADGKCSYVAAIFDVMVSTHSIEDLLEQNLELDDHYFQSSKDTGLRLCRKAREELGLELPIACLTIRQDAEVEAIETELGIPVYHRIPLDDSQSIDSFLDRHLPERSARL
jgi:CheY-like chemotaxis protein